MKPVVASFFLLCAVTAASAQISCSVAKPEPLTDAGRAFRARNYTEAEQLFRAKADTVTLTFAHVREQMHDVPAVDLSRLGGSAGTEISGLIGFYTLRELILSIDYRDSLVHVVYDPKHGMHNRR